MKLNKMSGIPNEPGTFWWREAVGGMWWPLKVIDVCNELRVCGHGLPSRGKLLELFTGGEWFGPRLAEPWESRWEPFFTPVDQTRFGRPEGNCTAAALASILGVPLDVVPGLADVNDWNACVAGLNAFLETLGWWLVWIDLNPIPLPLPWLSEELYHLMSGPNPDGIPHMTVGKGGQLHHDPNPSRRGIMHCDGLGLLTPLATRKRA